MFFFFFPATCFEVEALDPPRTNIKNWQSANPLTLTPHSLFTLSGGVFGRPAGRPAVQMRYGCVNGCASSSGCGSAHARVASHLADGGREGEKKEREYRRGSYREAFEGRGYPLAEWTFQGICSAAKAARRSPGGVWLGNNDLGNVCSVCPQRSSLRLSEVLCFIFEERDRFGNVLLILIVSFESAWVWRLRRQKKKKGRKKKSSADLQHFTPRDLFKRCSKTHSSAGVTDCVAGPLTFTLCHRAA